MKQFYVYIHKKPDGTPFYVGKSGTQRHKSIWRKHNPHHTNIVKKYGPDNIIVELIACRSESEAFDLEKIYIKQLKEAGYILCNLTDGGEGVGGYKRTEAEKLANGKRKKGNTYRRGSTHTEEAKEKNRQAHLGKKDTAQTIEKRRKAITKPRKSISGICMVYWYKSWKCWVAKINIGGKQKHLGYFDNYFDACCARKSAELEVYKKLFV
jgi:hypothetical protein